MVAEDLHAWLCIWVVCRLETQLFDTCITEQLIMKEATHLRRAYSF